MRIHGSHAVEQLLNPVANQSSGSLQKKRAGSNSSSAPGANVSDTLAAISSQLQLLPEVRPDVVSDVKARLQTGELTSLAAAEGTASAILNLGR